MKMQNEAKGVRDFRMFLQQKLLERCEKNPSYSLRAFAKSLGVGPSALSEMIRGKRAITPVMRQRLGFSLGLSMPEILEYQAKSKTKVKARVPVYKRVTLDTFAVISDWYHYAILELMKLNTFVGDEAWIAKTLGITKSEANIAIERLQRLGWLKVSPNGAWVDESPNPTTNIDKNLSSAAAKKLQKQILEQSIRALEELPKGTRDHTSMTMAIDPALLPEAIKRITKFRRELSDFLEKQGTAKEVYQLSLSLFPITHIETKIKSNGRDL